MIQREEFDPYYTWLGIPPSEQPPHFYRLLGMQLFEANRQVIENSADRQMMHLRTFQTGARSVQSQRLLNEVATARVCLLDAERKSSYDEELRRAQELQATPSVDASASSFTSGDFSAPDQFGGSAAPGLAPQGSRYKKPSRNRVNSLFFTSFVVLGGITGLALGVLIIFYLTGRDMLGWGARIRPPEGQPEITAAPVEKTPARRESLPAKNDNVFVPPQRTPSQPDVSEQLDTRSKPVASPAVSNPQTEPPAIASLSPAPIPASPTQASTEISEPAKPTLVLATTERVGKLPDLDFSSPTPLLRLNRLPTEALELTIHDDLADIPAIAAITTEIDPQSSGWMVNFRPARDAQGHETLATIHRDGLDLAVEWRMPFGDSKVRGQLSNCLLEVRHADEHQTVQLRGIAKSSPLVLDFEQDKHVAEFELSNMPASNKLFLKLRDVENFSQGGKVRGDASAFPLGKTAVIEFSEMPGAKVEVRLVKLTGSKLAVRVDAVFEERGDKDHELTFDHLEKVRASAQTSLSRARNDLSSVQSSLSSAQSNVRTLQSTNPSSLPEQQRLGAQLNAARAVVQRLNTQVVRLQKQIAEYQARLEAVPKIQEFMNSLQRRAKISFSICAGAGSKEIVLVESD